MDADIDKRWVDPSAILIATLGTEPQVVTAVLDLLAQQGVSIRKVIVVHTTSPDPRIFAALSALQMAFAQPPYSETISVEFSPLMGKDDRPLEDVQNLPAVNSAFRHIYKLVHTAKSNGDIVHLCIAGGRKSMAVFGMAAAQMLFDEQDCLWHLHSEGEFLESRRMHPYPEDQVSLIPIPVIRWGRIAPALTDLRNTDDPFEAAERIRSLQLSERLTQARSYMLGSLTPAERRVVEVLVRDGMSDYEIANQLSLSARTVEQHLRSAYQKAANYWELDGVNRTQLVALLSAYFLYEYRGNSG